MNQFPIAYAAYNKDDVVRFNSTSGGIFSSIAEYLIETRHALIYGAAFDKNFHVRHVSVDKIKDLRILRGSKYAQSDLGNTFVSVKENLQKGKTVLFTGTPCQVAGLKAYLNHPYPNLYCMDFICHGVASPEIWNLYVEELKKKGQISNIVFKYKFKGWKKWYFHVDYLDRSYYQMRGSMNTFMRSYLSYCNIRPSCFSCRFKGLEHCSDFTISDAWGIAENNKKINDDQGLSSLLLQNERAVMIFEAIKKNLEYVKYDANELMSGNWTAFRSVTPNPDRTAFFELKEKTDGFHALKAYFKPTILSWSKYYLLRIIRKER